MLAVIDGGWNSIFLLICTGRGKPRQLFINYASIFVYWISQDIFPFCRLHRSKIILGGEKAVKERMHEIVCLSLPIRYPPSPPSTKDSPYFFLLSRQTPTPTSLPAVPSLAFTFFPLFLREKRPHSVLLFPTFFAKYSCIVYKFTKEMTLLIPIFFLKI